jgi:putative SOS response-associated peptidase YedK
MCAHFIIIPQDELERMVADIQNTLRAERHGSVSALYEHAFPKADVPILVSEGLSGLMSVETMRWGYPVPWQKDVVFNTKTETALGDKPGMWASSIRHRRCVIPSFGFFEPHMSDTRISPKTGKPIKDQYFFRSPDSDIVWMAGIYEDGHFSIMTTAPNRWVKSIHRRMPVVLRLNELDTWLHGDYSTLADRSDMELVSERAA